MAVDEPIKLAGVADIAFETPDSHSHFFGYYDKSPFDAAGDRLLAHRVPFDRRRVEVDDEAKVGYFDLTSGDFTFLGSTQAFNWQQGSMLQWLPPDYDRRVIYNDRGDDGFRSVVVDVETGEETVLESPIYAVHPSGEYALTVNFERMAYCRPAYSYRGVRNEKWDVPLLDEDGIYRVDLETGERERVLSTREVCEFDWKREFETRANWLEHVMWNPSGDRFAVYHRWSDGNGGFNTRLFTASQDGSDLFLFPDTGVYSHLGWRDDERLTVWGIKPSSYQEAEHFVRDSDRLVSLVQPVYRFFKDRVIGSRMDAVLPDRCFLDFVDQSRDFEPLAPELLERDGHNSWSRDGRWMLTDTYPLEDHVQRLLIYDDRSREVHELGRFHSAAARTPYKCDLHPRWDRDDARVVVDSAYDERRQMIVLDQTVTT